MSAWELTSAIGSGLLWYVGFFAVAAIVGWALSRRRERRLRKARKDLLTSDAARIKGRMTRGATPTLLLTPARTAGFSKLGGNPDLPAGFAWPSAYDGKPRPFLAQVDLGAFRSHTGPDWLPREGRLYFFWDDATYGFPDLVKVAFSLAPPVHATPPPPGARQRFAERRVAFEAYTSLPSLDWLGVDLSEADLSDEELDGLADAPSAAFGDELQHRIGGYPSELQEERMWLACEHHRRGLPAPAWGAEIPDAIRRAARQWRLLIQIDSDPQLGMNFGGGRLYVFVREQDARTGDFSRTVTLSQTD